MNTALLGLRNRLIKYSTIKLIKSSKGNKYKPAQKSVNCIKTKIETNRRRKGYIKLSKDIATNI